jgi:hypothetical protein
MERPARAVFQIKLPDWYDKPTNKVSGVATIGTGLSSGWRKLGITPCSRAGATSHWQFSINHAGRRNVIATGRLLSVCSIMLC